MSDLRGIIAESVTRVFSEAVTPELRSGAEKSGPPAELWQLCAEQGFDQLLVPESQGGAGGTWTDAATVIRGCGEHAVPLPIPESLAARWLLSQAGIAQPSGPLALLPQPLQLDARDMLAGRAERIAWGSSADSLVGTGVRGTETHVVLISASDLAWQSGANVAGEPRDSAPISVRPVAQARVDLPPELPNFLGALLRAGQMAGASLAVLQKAVAYAGDRKQFGRPLAQFQVIQHNLARLAGAAATMNAAASSAFRATEAIGFGGAPGRDARLAIAMAKCRTAELTETVTGIAHQVHGAMGFTAEFGLHFWTRRLWSWRSEFGAAGVWAQWLGTTALRRGPARIWSDLSLLIGR